MNIDKAYTIARSALASAEDAQEIVIATNLRPLCAMLEDEIRAGAARSAKVQNSAPDSQERREKHPERLLS